MPQLLSEFAATGHVREQQRAPFLTNRVSLPDFTPNCAFERFLMSCLGSQQRPHLPQNMSKTPKRMFLTKRTRQAVENKGSEFAKSPKRTPNEPQTNCQKGPFWQNEPLRIEPGDLQRPTSRFDLARRLESRPTRPSFALQSTSKTPKSMFLTKRTRQAVENKGSGFAELPKRTPNEPQTNCQKSPFWQNEPLRIEPGDLQRLKSHFEPANRLESRPSRPSFELQSASKTPKSMFLTKRTRQPVENKGSGFAELRKRTPNEPQTNCQKSPFWQNEPVRFACANSRFLGLSLNSPGELNHTQPIGNYPARSKAEL